MGLELDWGVGVGGGVGSGTLGLELLGSGGMELGGLGSDGIGSEELELGGWSRRVGVGGLESGGSGGSELGMVAIGRLGSGDCSWFEITLKVLQLIYKYLVVSCAVFNYLAVGLHVPCSSLCCFQLPCSWLKSTL